MKPEQERISGIIVDTVSLLCRNGLSYKEGLKIEGVIGVTVDNSDVFIVHINDSFNHSDAFMVQTITPEDELMNAGNVSGDDASQNRHGIEHQQHVSSMFGEQVSGPSAEGRDLIQALPENQESCSSQSSATDIYVADNAASLQHSSNVDQTCTTDVEMPSLQLSAQPQSLEAASSAQPNDTTSMDVGKITDKCLYQGPRRYECTVCAAKFLTTETYKRHMWDVHGAHAEFYCEKCNKRFVYKAKFARHMEQHNGKIYKCTWCGTMSNTPRNLERHMKKNKRCKKIRISSLSSHRNLDRQKKDDNTLMPNGTEDKMLEANNNFLNKDANREAQDVDERTEVSEDAFHSAEQLSEHTELSEDTSDIYQKPSEDTELSEAAFDASQKPSESIELSEDVSDTYQTPSEDTEMSEDVSTVFQKLSENTELSESADDTFREPSEDTELSEGAVDTSYKTSEKTKWPEDAPDISEKTSAQSGKLPTPGILPRFRVTKSHGTRSHQSRHDSNATKKQPVVVLHDIVRAFHPLDLNIPQ